MIQDFFDGMLTLLLAKFVLNSVPHAVGIMPERSIGCDPQLIDKVRATAYYHGYRGSQPLRAKENYFTTDISDAEAYAEPGEHGQKVISATIHPIKVFCSVGPATAARDLSLWEGYRKVVPDLDDFFQLQRGEGWISGQIRRMGFDCWVRMGGELVIVYNLLILKDIKRL